MTEKIITVTKYERCSTDKQDLELQDQILNKTIKRLRENNPKIQYYILDFSDRAFSGKSAKRPQFQKMMRSIEKGKVDLVTFTKLDRLARSLQDLLNVTSKFEQHNVKFIVTVQNIDISIYHGRLQYQTIAQYHSI